MKTGAGDTISSIQPMNSFHITIRICTVPYSPLPMIIIIIIIIYLVPFYQLTK